MTNTTPKPEHVSTTYVSATDTTGSRIRARFRGRTMLVPYRYDVRDMHETAALAILKRDLSPSDAPRTIDADHVAYPAVNSRRFPVILVPNPLGPTPHVHEWIQHPGFVMCNGCESSRRTTGREK